MKRTQDTLLKVLLGLQYVREGHIITGKTDILVEVLAKGSTT